jgi:hypothetical protein
MASIQEKKTFPDPSIVVTNRTAIDSLGNIGSLYDGYRDCLLGRLNVKNAETLYHSTEEVRCNIIHTNNNQTQNLLQLLSIDEQLRLSILLELTPKKSIAQIIDYLPATKGFTRLFYYSYVHQTQKLPDNIEDVREFIKSSTNETKATHIITRVDSGIDFVIILELPYERETTDAIDRVLQRIRTILLNDKEISTLTSEEEKHLESIVHTKIYTNVHDLYRVNTLRDVCCYIEQNKKSDVHHPVSYSLRSIKWLNPYYTGESAIFISLPTSLINDIEEHILQLRNDIKQLEASIYKNVPQLLCGYLKERQSKLQKQWSDIDNKYKSEIQRLSKLITDIRSGRTVIPTFEQICKNNEQVSITKSIHDLTEHLHELQLKGELITSLNEQKFHYYNVTDYNIDHADNAKSIERKLVSNEQEDRVLCSDDALNKTKSKQLRDLRRNMVEDLNKNSGLRLIYADFSYCSYELEYMMRLPSSAYDMENNKSLLPKKPPSSKEIQHSTFSSTETKTSHPLPKETQITTSASPKVRFIDVPPTNIETNASLLAESKTFLPVINEKRISDSAGKKPPAVSAPEKVQTMDASSTTTQAKPQPSFPLLTEIPIPVLAPIKQQTHTSPLKEIQNHQPSKLKPLPANDVINILLLGETGVGKSTFINAFANYLTFNTMQQAEQGRPVVLIPVSFLITVGNNFDEYIVKFGDVDGSNNEDFEHPGQSVTQHCRSYVFNVDYNHGKKVCIIDTPGFGDTRGIDQDDYNMTHILEYIRDLSHLDAVCFLLKPNESRLNIFFRSCFIQLFSLLGPNIADNILFCFTNSRSTFYTPGNTAPLLKKMLTSLSKNDIPFKQANTFCFDNESFRYLVALRNKIPFSVHDKQEYEMSWTKSVTEANRLLDYIRIHLRAYRISNKR